VEEIHLWWIGEREASARMIEHVRIHLDRAFAWPVRLHSGADRPRDAWDPRRRQWSSTRILRWLGESGPKSGKLLGITDVDLFIPILTYVFGEAQVGGRAAVVSTRRLGEPSLPDARIVVDRLATESVHEVGHLFGLLHCSTAGCAMGRAAGVRDVDAKRAELCPACRRQLERSRREGT
jgi:archaemetzincin